MQLGSESTRSRWMTGLLYALTCLIGLGAVVGCGRDEAPVDPQVYLDAHDLNKNLELARSKDARMRILGCIRLGRMGAYKARSLFTWSGVAQQLLATVNGGPGLERLMEDTEWEEPWNDSD